MILLKRIVIVLAFTLIISACGNSNTKNENASGSGTASDEKVTVTMGFWGTAEDLKIYTDAAKAVSTENQNIKLEIKQYPSSEQFWDTLPAEIAAGVAPDFIKVSNEGAYEYISKGLFAPIDEIIESSKIDMSVFDKNVVNIWKEAGLGDKYPKTWDEVFTAAKALTKEEQYGIGINLHPFHITNYIKSYGGDWKNGEAINSEENVQALEKVLEMYEAGVAVTPKELGFGWDGEVFANEKAAMTTGGYWYKSFLKDANPDLNYVALPIPEGTTKGSTMISDAYVVLKDTKNKEAAIHAAYALTSEEVQKQFMKIGNNPSRTALSEQYFEENPEFSAIESSLEYSTDWQYPKNTKKFTDTLAQELEARVLGGSGKTAKEILDSIQ